MRTESGRLLSHPKPEALVVGEASNLLSRLDSFGGVVSWFKTISRNAGLALGAAFAVTLLAGAAEAQIGPARRVEGAPVAAEAVHARFVFSMSGNRIVFVNQADEVYYHRVTGNHVDMHIRMRGNTIGRAGDPTEYVIPESNDRILVVTRRGDLFRHEIRAESIGPAAQIPGAPVGTQGQDPVFMFMIGNQLVNVTQQGEIWTHQIGTTVAPPRRIGRYALAAPRVVRHVFNIGRRVYIISDQGEVYAHDIHPELGRGQLINSRTLELGQPATRFVFTMGNRLFGVNERGEVWVHDITRLIPRGAQAPTAPPGTPAPTAPAPAPAPAQ